MEEVARWDHKRVVAPLSLKLYFSWIANLGVVPLFLFPALRFVPLLFAFVLRRVSEAAVFETILPLQSKLTFRNCLLVPVLLLIVKGGFATEIKSGDIILGKGEHKTIEIGKLNKFTISNSEVLSYKLDEESGKLLIKGKSTGFSEILILKKDKTEDQKRVFIVSKQKQLTLAEVTANLQSIGLNSHQEGDLLIITGELQDFKAYSIFRKILADEKILLYSNVKLRKELRNEIIGRVYKEMLDQYVENISCKEFNSKILCDYESEIEIPKDFIEYISREYGVQIMHKKIIISKNYRVRLKLIQIEKLDGLDLNFGLDHLDTTLGELFVIGPTNVIKKNAVFLQKNSLHISTLAEPENIIVVGGDSHISVGAEIPFETRNKDGEPNTTFKFAGLLVKLQMQKVENRYRINFKTEFTSPGNNGSISGSKEESSVFLKLSSPQELFKINFKTTGERESAFPLISSIPIIGEIFKSKSNQGNYKNITGVIVLEPYEI